MQRNDNVINMMDRGGLGAFPACTIVESYWESLRQNNNVPERAKVDPRGIEDALNHAFILESIGSGLARVRVAGTQMSELMGMEVRGMPISSLITPASRDPFGRTLKAVLNGPAKMRLSLRSEKTWGQPQIQAEMLLLPLRSEAGSVTRVLGCIEAVGTIGRAPRRFEIVTAAKTMLAERAAYAAQEPKTTELAESQSRFDGQSGRPSYLRLIKSDTDTD